ncbi:translation initiation factor IF-2 [Proteinivorax hydrogeniformans]|uniref:Translation initiation factor IF-2 n=1 Tax=Proteinivorax hydrogeniformans TaxID=1826727 RepID=A0AAU8HQQ5_9FIRM
MTKKYRVYEVAKDLSITSKELIEQLKGSKLEVSNHMSTLSEQEVEEVFNLFTNDKEDKSSEESPIEGNEQDLEKEEKKTKTKKKKNKKRSKKQNNKQQSQSTKDDQMNNKIILSNDSITVAELAEQIDVSSTDIIKKLMGLGVMASVNQSLDKDTVELVALEYGASVETKSEDDEQEDKLEFDDKAEDLKPRSPVVTVLGHVDHGKTTLLDSIRNTKVTTGEAGGITQHIGAYQVRVNDSKITFIDTPGHAAFTAMRARGAQVTDIAILVVAADDGVMPQTVEAINHAKAAGVPIIVAVNKIDRPNANVEKIKQELTNYNLVPEDWGGETVFAELSALKGEGIDNLLEMVTLVSEMQELKANPNALASGTVIESKLDKGRGPVATVLVRRGTLSVGDSIVSGTAFGKVRAMINDKGKQIKKAKPSTPVEILGLSEAPQAGENFRAMENDKNARNLAQQKLDKDKSDLMKNSSAVSLDDLFKSIQEGQIKDLNIIVKADVQGSSEAIKHSLEKLSDENVNVRVIHTGVGAITENDVMLASASSAIIIGFNVRPDSSAQKAAKKDGVDLRLYRIIYDAIEDVKKAMLGLLEPEFEEVFVGKAEVRQTFKASKIGTIAGSYILEGKMVKNYGVRLIRDGIVIYEGKLDTLKRFKDDVKEVSTGYECGILLENFNDVKDGDIVECFTEEEVKPV